MSLVLEQFSLKDKVSIVTGGSRGLGYGIAAALASAGAKVVIVSRTAGEVEAASLRIAEETNGIAIPVVADVTKEKDVEDLIATTLEKCGSINILVNNAGTNVRKPFLEISREDFDEVIGVNLKAVFFLTQLVAKEMIKKKKGKIINIASLTSQIGIANISVYAATKGAIASLTRTLAVELAPHNINVNAIAPGYFRTQMTEAVFQDEERRKWILSRIPLGRTGIPQDLVGAAVFLASSASDYITGQIIFVDGGWIAA